MSYPGGSNSVSLSVDPDLGRLIDAWPELSSAMKAGILALVDAVTDTRRSSRTIPLEPAKERG